MHTSTLTALTLTAKLSCLRGLEHRQATWAAPTAEAGAARTVALVAAPLQAFGRAAPDGDSTCLEAQGGMPVACREKYQAGLLRHCAPWHATSSVLHLPQGRGSMCCTLQAKAQPEKQAFLSRHASHCAGAVADVARASTNRTALSSSPTSGSSSQGSSSSNRGEGSAPLPTCSGPRSRAAVMGRTVGSDPTVPRSSRCGKWSKVLPGMNFNTQLQFSLSA